MSRPRLSVVLTLGLVVAAAGTACAAELAQPEPGELGRHVNPFIGTGGVVYLSGFVSPAASVPLGMVRLGPDTQDAGGKRANNSSGYYYGDPRIHGFSHTRLSGTGAVDGGHFLVVPANGSLKMKSRRSGLNAALDHEQEKAFPGYYAIGLPKQKINVELTATRRVGVHRYAFAGDDPHVRIHVTNALGKGRAAEGEVRVLPDTQEVEGTARTFGSFSGRYGGLKAYFVARFSRPVASFATWSGDELTSGRSEATGNDVGVDLAFAPEDKPVEVRLGMSYVSIENARENLDAEAAGKSFEEIVEAAKKEWEEVLSRVRVEGGTESERTIFYTAMYHSFIMPTSFNDVDGDYLGFDKQIHKAEGFTYYTDMSLWDTFRTTHPLYTIIAPDEQRDMVVSLVEMAKQGGYLPRWPSGGGYTNSMLGTPADCVIAETYLKGITDFDVETAYEAMRRTALAPTPQGAPFSGREGVDSYLKLGYCAADQMEEAVGRTLEFCWSDYAIAQLAAALGKKEDAALFDEHARFYKNLWNPETQYFHPRNADGSFTTAFDPLLLTYLDFSGQYTNDYVEGSALQWRWCVPHDPEGLVELFGSREHFVEELEKFFANSVPAVGKNPNAYYWHGNQPDLHAAYLFNAAGRPDLTQKWVRWILAKKYGDGPDGLDGNDDGGTLSAWYVLSSLGIYPVAGTDRYDLGSPLWPRAEVKIGDETLTVVADNAGPENVYVRRVTLNGQELSRTWIKHAEIAPGGELRFEMSAEPAAAAAQ